MKEALDFLSSKDAVLRSVVESFGQPAVQRRDQGFAALAHIILEQQVSIASAKAAYLKLQRTLGEVTAEAVSALADEGFRDCGISRQKTVYLRDLAHKVRNGILDFSSFAHKPVEAVSAELLAVKGVGNWTVEVYLMFCLQSPDIIPLGDIAIRKAITELYGITDPVQMRQLADGWKPYRSLASFILWHHYLAKRNRL